MIFLDQPPAAIGDVVHSWTNNGPDGPQHGPLWVRLLTVALPVMGGFVLGLVGFFVAGGIFESRGGRVQGSWFLYSLGAGAALGLVIGVLLALRPARRATLYVGRDGCAVFRAGKLDLLEFRDVEKLRVHVSVMTYNGIRTSAREFHVTRNGREQLWFVSSDEKKGDDDPNYDFGRALLRAYEARQPA
jgi:hypothetical protein